MEFSLRSSSYIFLLISSLSCYGQARRREVGIARLSRALDAARWTLGPGSRQSWQEGVLHVVLRTELHLDKRVVLADG